MTNGWIKGKITGQKVIEGGVYLEVSGSGIQHYFKPKSFNQQKFLMDTRGTTMLFLISRKRHSNIVKLIKCKVLTERDKKMHRLIKSSKTKKVLRVAQEERLEALEKVNQVGADCLHTSHITKAIEKFRTNQ